MNEFNGYNSFIWMWIVLGMFKVNVFMNIELLVEILLLFVMYFVMVKYLIYLKCKVIFDF